MAAPERHTSGMCAAHVRKDYSGDTITTAAKRLELFSALPLTPVEAKLHAEDVPEFPGRAPPSICGGWDRASAHAATITRAPPLWRSHIGGHRRHWSGTPRNANPCAHVPLDDGL